MNVWELSAEADHRLSLASDLTYFHKHFIAQTMATHWKPPKVEIRGKTLPLRDFVSWMVKAPVISERARAAFEPLISQDCEILPLIKIRRKMYYAVNVLTTLKCLNLEASDVAYSPNDPLRIVNIWRYVFHAEKVPKETIIFKIPEDHFSGVFVTKRFIDIVRANELTGSMFLDPAASRFAKLMRGESLNVIPGLP